MHHVGKNTPIHAHTHTPNILLCSHGTRSLKIVACVCVWRAIIGQYTCMRGGVVWNTYTHTRTAHTCGGSAAMQHNAGTGVVVHSSVSQAQPTGEHTQNTPTTFHGRRVAGAANGRRQPVCVVCVFSCVRACVVHPSVANQSILDDDRARMQIDCKQEIRTARAL